MFFSARTVAAALRISSLSVLLIIWQLIFSTWRECFVITKGWQKRFTESLFALVAVLQVILFVALANLKSLDDACWPAWLVFETVISVGFEEGILTLPPFTYIKPRSKLNVQNRLVQRNSPVPLASLAQWMCLLSRTDSMQTVSLLKLMNVWKADICASRQFITGALTTTWRYNELLSTTCTAVGC
jgi:hypothetical protein